jgi:hypothetical protein
LGQGAGITVSVLSVSSRGILAGRVGGKLGGGVGDDLLSIAFMAVIWLRDLLLQEAVVMNPAHHSGASTARLVVVFRTPRA